MFRKLKKLTTFAIVTVLLFVYLGVFTHLFEEDFDLGFQYPYSGDIEELVQQLRNNVTPSVPPINSYNFEFLSDCKDKCRHIETVRLVFLIKSAPQNGNRRLAIRNSWGYENRFSDVNIRRIFLVGLVNSPALQNAMDQESQTYKDIVQGNFADDYYNNTLKTMMGFTWAVQYCNRAKFYMFVDDDYYVSTKNLLRFVRNPANYPDYLKKSNQRTLNQFDFDLEDNVRLYSGYVFKSSPLRHFSSKWYISLSEYPYDKWPPYVSAGAYVLSKEALADMYYASFYTKHFKFDDIYVALLAYKCKIESFHCDKFYFYKAQYDPKSYEYVIASHGYTDSNEMITVWTQQRTLGHA